MITNECPLIFTHIPKTGGMSMFAGMAEQYGMEIADMYDMSAYYHEPAPVEALLTDTDKHIYAGHFPFGLHEWLSRPCCYMAIVRKPLERIISLYHYSIQYRDLVLNTRKETGQSLQELFDNRTVPDFYLDFLPWIKGEQTLAGFLRCLSPELDNGMVRRFSGIGLDTYPCPREALDMAKDNIENYFSVVGVQERYQDTVQMVRATFDVDLTEFHVNKGVQKQQKGGKVNLALKRRIKEMNRMDADLYNWIYERFDKKLANPTPPVIVQGGGRTDFDKVKLWRAIGNSPMRKAAMELSPATRAKK
jgi:hypothetical protein